MDLQTLANVAQILGAVAVVAAIVFGFVQIRQFRVQRRDAAAAELVRSFQDASFTQSFRLITALPDNATAEQLRSGGRTCSCGRRPRLFHRFNDPRFTIKDSALTFLS